MVKHRGQRNSTRKAFEVVAEDAARANVELEASLRACQHTEKSLERKLESCRQENIEIMDILRHALEELLRASVPPTPALLRRIERHVPGVLDLISGNSQTPMSMDRQHTANAGTSESSSNDSTSTNTLSSEHTGATEPPLYANPVGVNARSVSYLFGEPTAKRQRHNHFEMAAPTQSDCFNDLAPSLPRDMPPHSSATQLSPSSDPQAREVDTPIVADNMPQTKISACPPPQQQQQLQRFQNSMGGELPQTSSSLLNETRLSSRRMNEVKTGGVISDAPPGNAPVSSLQHSHILFQHLHNSAPEATIDRHAETLGTYTQAAASGSSQPTSSSFQSSDVPGEIDWSSWMQPDDVDPVYSFGRDDQAGPFDSSTPAPGWQMPT